MIKTKVIITFLCLLTSFTVQAKSADTVLIGGKILTVDADFSIADSIAVSKGRIIAVGNEKTITPYIDNATKIIKLDGKTVIPGLIDNHFHFIRSVWNNQFEVRLDGVKSHTEALHLLKKKAESLPEGTWITVIGGWLEGQFNDNNNGFTLAELDAISLNHPIFLLRNYSNAYVNSRAFKSINMTSTGKAKITGRKNIAKFINETTWRNRTSSKEAILTYMNKLNKVGITTLYDVGRQSEGNLQPLFDLASEGPMPLRVFNTLRYRANNEKSAKKAIELINSGTVRPFSNDLQSGTIGLGEHIYAPVSDNPRQTNNWPALDWKPFSDIAFAAAKSGWTVHEHVMSKATAVQYLDLIEVISEEIPTIKTLRWTLAHANGMTEKEINRAKDLGVAIAVHSQARMTTRGRDKPLIGTIANSGVLWGLGSDAAVVAPYSPFNSLEWVISGTNITGAESWSKEQRVSRAVALRAHTLQNAQLLFLEKDLGSLEVGKLADLVVLDQDYMNIAEDKISQIKATMTMTNGRVVYSQ